jgi:hypothetical protein
MTQPDSRGFMDEQAQLAALAPLTVIRTETVLSKLPIHNLAKKGKVDIRIVRKGQGGDVQLKWEVSHNDRYGQPRQLAYKLDTLIVNRRLDESSRPLPTIIRMGSLKEISRELGLKESGKINKDLRIAFLQNASAFINAQLTYRTADGGERRLEAAFSRYGVVFTGENLPDGRRADCVYLVLNQPYWEVVNHAPVRPLNYDYLRELTPAAQRFYEIVSYRIFAALKHNRPQARILYSDFCAYSAQQRYYDHEHFRVQMYKLHKVHLDSGYLKAVAITPAVDGEGKPDWLLAYTPGPKARAEYESFSGKLRVSIEESDEPAPATTAPDLPPAATTAPPGENPLLAELTRRGIAPRTAARLLRDHPQTCDIADQIEWADYVVNSAAIPLRNPPGFYVSLLRDGVSPPSSFVSSRRHREQESSRLQADQEAAAALQCQEAYEQYVNAALDLAFASLSPEQLATQTSEKRKHYRRQFPHLFDETLEHLARQGVRNELREQLRLRTLAEFSRQFRTEGTQGL